MSELIGSEPADPSGQGTDAVGRNGRRTERRSAGWFSFAVLLGLALLAGSVSAWQGDALGFFSSLARSAFAQGGIAGYAVAALATGMWGLVMGAQLGIVLAGWFLIEFWFDGKPRGLRVFGLLVVMQFALVVFYYFAAPYILMVMPRGLFEPLLTMRSENVPALFKPVVDVVLALAALTFSGFVAYWAHRASHQIPFLWHFHRIHHGIEHIDAVSDVVHPVDVLVVRLGSVLLAVLLGFEYQTFALLIALNTVFARMQHTRAPITLGPLGKVLSDKRFHLTHHSLDPKYYDKNFSSSFIAFDKWFGTYVEPDGKPIKMGLPDEYGARNPWEFVTARLAKRDQNSRSPL